MNEKELMGKIGDILEEFAAYIYYEGDPKRGGISADEALKQIVKIVKIIKSK
jgi:hypothetical protein